MFERENGAEDRSFLRKMPFEYLVLDEAHCIKNSQSARYSNLRGLNPKRRLLLSGTPVQNDVRELLALLSFLMPRVFRTEYIDFLYDSFMDRFIDHNDKDKDKDKNKKEVSSKISKNVKAKPALLANGDGDDGTDVTELTATATATAAASSNSSLQELRCMLAPFVLRRLKCDVLRQMPPKIGMYVRTYVYVCVCVCVLCVSW
jgi:SNF2 family DNA or RNA helicase